MALIIFTDGAARGNPGPAGIGVVIFKNSKIISEISDYIGKTTNNVAEYIALTRGLEEALLLGEKEVEVNADSELVVKQIKGEYKVKNEGLAPLHYNAQALIKKFKRFNIKYIPREKNELADRLANKGIDEVIYKQGQAS
ncbi:MAG: ribonuclease H [Candidatus Saganbacteria bacterium]|uniref:Ribonuclease H n=1 Tax=Candidatus Saganbacteria bacterium TaxID=2575572 RepID=A0A833KZK9_UNCSA|nr:MAG: ribonuclease H [Candidatus Saganbacteria bacterium]